MLRFGNSCRSWTGVTFVVAITFVQQLQLLLAYHISSTRVDLHEHKISSNNDTAYVREIMRLAKAAEMGNYMKPEVDACDDFFAYACGNWAKINPAGFVIPRQTNFFQLLTKSYNQKQLKILQEAEQKSDSEPIKIVKRFFNACMNLPNPKEKRQYEFKLRQILQDFGEMPALWPDGAWAASDFNWQRTIAQIQKKYGLDILLSIYIRPDFTNKTINKLFLRQPAFRLQTESMYTSETTKFHRENYKQEIKNNLIIQLKVEEEKAERVAAEILEIETALAAGILDRKLGKTFKSMTTLRTLSELNEAYNNTFDFKQFIETSLNQTFNDTLYEYMPAYQENLFEVVRSTTPERLANYIMYQLIHNFLMKTNEKVAVREGKCFEKTKFFFTKILDNTIFHKYNSKNTINDINLIWSQIKTIFKAELESEKLGWISLMTRKLALEKLDAMKLEINSYENINLTEEYATLNIDSNDYVENVEQLLIFHSKRVVKSLHEIGKPFESPQILSFSSAYIATHNIIKIPVSLLQPNYLWSDHYPQALKFGTLGYLVAHELIHGFDDMGRNFDVNGNEIGWWDANSTEAFNERKACFKDQYARYRYGGKYLPENELQAENIADNGAVKIAFSAYTNWLTSAFDNVPQDMVEPEIELLPNMNYTNKQLFFISFAQFWCNDVNKLLKDEEPLVDVHAPAMFRVIGSLANFAEFSNEFHCGQGTTMNPENRCEIY
ncbi:neprilysin-1-like [Teleopsis dalmanni]|uniref:neprilysin-1-like n=1 Tax=Teleopsis dalmanni TaxID=139649 RepID=UPI0018CE68FB|nr:neprilysin-1-like [Teleopsis dalmanni]